MYKTFKITEDFLINNNACPKGLSYFRKYFPNGITISNSQEEMINLLLKYEGDFSYLSWLTSKLVDGMFTKYYVGYSPYGKGPGFIDTDSTPSRCMCCASDSTPSEMEVHYSDLPTIGVLISDSKYLK